MIVLATGNHQPSVGQNRAREIERLIVALQIRGMFPRAIQIASIDVRRERVPVVFAATLHHHRAVGHLIGDERAIRWLVRQTLHRLRTYRCRKYGEQECKRERYTTKH